MRVTYRGKPDARGHLAWHPQAMRLRLPLLLGALVVNRGDPQIRAVLLSGAILVWMLRSLRFALGSRQRNIGRAVSGLLAGIPLIDLLSIWEGSPAVAVLFLGLFLTALLFQRFIPAT